MNLLPGRVIYLRMDPITIEENKNSKLSDLLIYGSLPEVITTVKNEFKEDYLYSYVGTYLEEEIRKEALLRKLPDFVKFLEIAALESGLIVNYSSIASEIGISHLTVKSYFEIMESTLMGDLIWPVTESVTRKKLSKSPRFLFFDLGVRRVTANEGTKLGSTRMGQIFEQFIGIELLRLMRSYKLRVELNYWRDSHTGEEVDWVLKKAKTFIPIEVKFKTVPDSNDIKHLQKFLLEYDCPHGGYVVCQTSARLKLDKNIYAISWRDLYSVLKNIK